MNQITKLAANYRRHVSVPWQRTMAGAQRVMIVVYAKERERALRYGVDEFEEATRDAGHKWILTDASPWFAEWMAADDYREAYFEDPELLSMKLAGEFKDAAARRLCKVLEDADENTVVALLGAATLYGFLRVSELIQSVEPSIQRTPGRFLSRYQERQQLPPFGRARRMELPGPADHPPRGLDALSSPWTRSPRHSSGDASALDRFASPVHNVKTTLHYVMFSIHSVTSRLRSALLLGRIAVLFPSRRALPARRLAALGARAALSTDC